MMQHCYMVLATPHIRTRAQQIVEARLGEPVEAYIARRYLDDGLTQQQIADELGVSRASVVRWMPALDIPTRGRGGRRAA